MSVTDISAPVDLCAMPLEVEVLGQAVVIVGPHGVSLAMTAEAAASSVEALARAVERARLTG